MGCEEVREIEQGRRPESGKQVDIKIYTGHLYKPDEEEEDFKNCLITNKLELEENLRQYIPTRYLDENGDEVKNIYDDILINQLNIDFSCHYLIVFKAMNITKVEEVYGNYMVYHDDVSSSRFKYNAALVEKLDGNPKVLLASPELPPTD